MQIFNMLNSRVIKDEINILKGILDSHMYIAVFSVIVILQVLRVLVVLGFAMNTKEERTNACPAHPAAYYADAGARHLPLHQTERL